jgi:hypothetical protein
MARSMLAKPPGQLARRGINEYIEISLRISGAGGAADSPELDTSRARYSPSSIVELQKRTPRRPKTSGRLAWKNRSVAQTAGSSRDVMRCQTRFSLLAWLLLSASSYSDRNHEGWEGEPGARSREWLIPAFLDVYYCTARAKSCRIP